jgi:hypothetical protein
MQSNRQESGFTLRIIGVAVSPKKTKTELEEDALRKKVNHMYENYGIDPGSEEADLTRVYRYYRENSEQLDLDHQKSKEHADQFSDEETL